MGNHPATFGLQHFTWKITLVQKYKSAVQIPKFVEGVGGVTHTITKLNNNKKEDAKILVFVVLSFLLLLLFSMTSPPLLLTALKLPV